jgi:hypothetical protein
MNNTERERARRHRRALYRVRLPRRQIAESRHRGFPQ